jgi:hypothetical protein
MRRDIPNLTVKTAQIADFAIEPASTAAQRASAQTLTLSERVFMRSATTSSHGLSGPWPALAPVGLFLVVAATMIVGRSPPPMTWLAPICFGAFASLILLWRSGAPVFAQSCLSLLVIVELLMVSVRSDALGMRGVESNVSTAIASSDAEPIEASAPTAVAPASRVSIATTSAAAAREADDLSRRIQQSLPDHLRNSEIQGDLKVDRFKSDTRLALSWSVGPAGNATWCGSTSVFAADAQAGVALLAAEVVKRLSPPRGARPGCGSRPT